MKRILFLLALLLALSFSLTAEAATKATSRELTLGGYDDESKQDVPDTINEAISMAIDIIQTEDEEIDYESYKNLSIVVDSNYTLDGDDVELTGLDDLETLTINGRGHTFTPYDDSDRYFRFTENGPTITLQRITFDGGEGGGIMIENGTVSLDTVTFNGIDVTGLDEESEERNGAAVRITGGTVNFGGRNSFSGNKAANGGAIHVSGGTVNFSGTNTFRGMNEAEESGGAIQVTGGTVIFSGTTEFRDNTSAEYGGAVDVNGSNASVTFSDVKFGIDANVNSAGYGGAVSVRAGTAAFNNSEFKGNNATDGGALHLAGNVTLASGSKFEANVATGNGGAMYIADGRNVSITGAITFENNEAAMGGAVYLPESENSQLKITGSEAVTFKGNYAETAGGGIYASRYSSMSFGSTVNFDANYTTNGNGGALAIYAPNQLPTSTINFTNNRARRSSGSTSTTEGNGGAIYIYGQETTALTLTSSTNYTFNGNTADYSGGAIYTVSSDININGVDFTSKNTAVNGYGGFVRSGGSVTVENATISNQQGTFGGAIYGEIVNVENSTFSANLSTNSGGAIYAADVLDVSGSTFTNNGSDSSLKTNYGGAIYSLGPVTIDNCTFTGNSTSAQSQNQGGGALFISSDNASTITSSDFTNNKHNDNGQTSNYGGAIFARGGRLTLTNDTFRGNRADGTNGNRGGAVFAETVSPLRVTNSIFDENKANGNGGAVCIGSNSTSTFTYVTFSDNGSTSGSGGAIQAQGNITISSCDLHDNYATSGNGGGVYFNQTAGNSEFTIIKSMLTDNTAAGGYGGALYVAVESATIDKCTFNNNNSANAGANSQGGAIYLKIGSKQGEISNSTFINNSASGGTENYGGALFLDGQVRVVMSTFTDNSATERGGAIYIYSGPFTLAATIVVGNQTSSGVGQDIYANTKNLISGGYNRIGYFGQGESGSTPNNTSWTVEVSGNKDTDRQNENFKRSDFFGTQTLAPNGITGSIGYTEEEIQLLTLMLSEDEHLALADRATNVIPYSRRYSFPQYDQRGVDRYASGNDLSIGAVNFDGDNPGPDPDDPSTNYTIQSIIMSGIPNTLRSIGQTASLTAQIRYTNGRTAYGVPYDASTIATGEERVRWTSSSNNTVKIDKNGNITALATTPNNSYVTITVSTVRNSVNGNPATDSRPVRVTGQYSNMNVSTEWQNYFMNYVQEITEEDISLMLVDESSSTVRSSSFQRSFKDIWNVDTATHITDLTSSTPSFTTPKSYTASDGYVNSKNAAVNINFQNRTNGDIFPLTYTWNFSGDEIKTLLGSDLSGTSTLNSSTAENLFKALRVDFVGSSNTWQVIGGSGISAKDAFTNGALALTKTDANRGVRIDLTAYLATVKASGNNDGPQLVKGSGSNKLLIIPDGSDDGAISGTMWMVQSSSSKGNSNEQKTPDTNNNTSNGSGGGSGGGGGCEAFSFGLLGLALIFMKRK